MVRFRRHDDDKKKRAPRRRWFTIVIWIAIGIVSILLAHQALSFFYLNVIVTRDESIITQEPCAPPCWYGLYPGQSTYDDVNRVLSNSDFIPEWIINRDERVIYWHWADFRGVFTFFDDNTLRSMRIQPNYRFPISEIETLYGTPDALEARVSRGHRGEPEVEMTFYFLSSGLIINARFPIEIAETYTIPLDLEGEAFTLVRPSETLEELILQAYPTWDETVFSNRIDYFNLHWYGLGSTLIPDEELSIFLLRNVP